MAPLSNQKNPVIHSMIKTKYKRASEYKAPRVKAYYKTRTITVPWSSEISYVDNHVNAVVSLANKLGLSYNEIVMAEDSKGYAFILI